MVQPMRRQRLAGCGLLPPCVTSTVQRQAFACVLSNPANNPNQNYLVFVQRCYGSGQQGCAEVGDVGAGDEHLHQSRCVLSQVSSKEEAGFAAEAWCDRFHLKGREGPRGGGDKVLGT